MPADVDSAAEVTLFLDEDGGLLVRGGSQAVDTVLAELLTPAEIEAHRRVTSRVTDLTAAGASAAAVAAEAQEYLRLTAGSVEKVRQFGAQTDGTGALRGYVRDQGGHFCRELVVRDRDVRRRTGTGSSDRRCLDGASVGHCQC